MSTINYGVPTTPACFTFTVPSNGSITQSFGGTSDSTMIKNLSVSTPVFIQLNGLSTAQFELDGGETIVFSKGEFQLTSVYCFTGSGAIAAPMQVICGLLP